jgi:RNA polymerase sigma-70 factor (ECF subfamily)
VDLQHEHKLIHAAKNGDSDAMAALYDAYVDRIYRYILYRVENVDSARDLTSEVFLRLVRSLHSFQPRETPLLGWLYRVAHARVIDHYRRNDRAKEYVSLEILERHASGEDDLESDLMRSNEQQAVVAALKLLTHEQQQVILLRFTEGLDLQQTADALGKTVGAVKVMQHRAVQALRRALAKIEANGNGRPHDWQEDVDPDLSPGVRKFGPGQP